MDELPPTLAHSSIRKRAQKIRERMMLEMASGVPASEKGAFLSLCLQHEQNLTASEVARGKREFWGSHHVENARDNAYGLDDWKWWDEGGFTDWQKFNTIISIAIPD